MGSHSAMVQVVIVRSGVASRRVSENVLVSGELCGRMGGLSTVGILCELSREQ